MSTKKTKSSEVDQFQKENDQWQNEIKKMRKVFLDNGLTEEWKWAKPCYSHDGKNIVIIQAFKAYFAILFFKGSLLKDPEKILEKAGENSEAGRQMRFKSDKEIAAMEATIKNYIKEAIAIEESGFKRKTTSKKLSYPSEFQEKLDKNAKLKAAFESLTPGRQKGYYLYFSSAKQSKTIEDRVTKCIPKILKGEGLNDF